MIRIDVNSKTYFTQRAGAVWTHQLIAEVKEKVAAKLFIHEKK
ncbi:hypothetical protein [uncultured Chitinophaga sp.]|nr:hypothetical protein [uncultured Chitinophaga sp.]